MGEMPSVGVSLRYPSSYLHEFWRKSRKTPNGWSTSATRDWTWHFPSTSFERRLSQPLAGPRTDSLTFMPYPEFDPGTIGAVAGSPSHYTAWSAYYWRKIHFIFFGTAAIEYKWREILHEMLEDDMLYNLTFRKNFSRIKCVSKLT